MRGNGYKLEESRLRLDSRKRFFTVRMVSQQNRLPREVVDTSSQEVFKAKLDGVLNNLLQWKEFLLMAVRLDLDDL